MPSPFPGMDPFLEHPGHWPDLHAHFISIASEVLTSQLRPKYVARIEERVYIADEWNETTLIVHDLHLSPREGREKQPLLLPAFVEAETATVEPVMITTILDDDAHEHRLEIIDVAERRVVTVLEVLSPSNKVIGSEGRLSFEKKRREVMRSPAHWVEIDLLRTGKGFAHRPPRHPSEYLVHVSRAGRRPEGVFCPIRLSQRLPTIKIPLLSDDPDASLDLQAVLTTAYDRAGYDLSIDYTAPPVPPLPPEWDAWADALLKARGLRKE